MSNNLEINNKSKIALQENNKISYNNQVLYSFKKYFGINFGKTSKLIKYLGINKYSKLKYLDKIIYNKMLSIINYKYRVTKYLIKRFIYIQIKKRYKIKNYVGYRHLKNLPVNGQRTHTNRNTQRNLKIFLTLANIFETKLVVKEIQEKEKEEKKINIKKRHGKRGISIKKK